MISQNAKNKGKRRVEANRNSLNYFEKRKSSLPDLKQALSLFIVVWLRNRMICE